MSVFVLLTLLALFGLTVGLTMIVGALQMMRLRSYGWAMTASILALLPLGPVGVLGLCMGIWSLYVLNQPNVRAAFAVKPVRKPADTSVGRR